MPAAATPPLRRFVVLAAPRTGSNWLCTLLDSHPEILCHHEIFNPEGVHYALGLRDGSFDLGSVAERDRAPEVVLERIWSESRGRRAVGFKLNRDQDERVFRHVLADPGIAKILLRRRNRIRTYVSERIAERTGEWESYARSGVGGNAEGIAAGRAESSAAGSSEGSAKETTASSIEGIAEYAANIGAAPRRLTVDAAALRAGIERNERYYAALEAELRAGGRPHLDLVYEQLRDDEERRRILRFLGVAERPELLTGGTRKQNPYPLSATIANFAELAEELRGSELEAELYTEDL